MNNVIRILGVPLLMSLCWAACSGGSDSSREHPSQGQDNISGRMEAGLRVLSFDPTAEGQKFRIYRGDYVRPEIVGGGRLHLVIPDLKVDASYPVAKGQGKPYFKVPGTGSFTFTAGKASGVIEAIDFTSATYQEVSAEQATQIIQNISPVILDVRTEGEYRDGHLADSILIPVQVLQKRIGELDQYQERPVFVYCRSGNRSTVAARMLIAKGFKRVINLRDGVIGWSQAGYSLEK